VTEVEVSEKSVDEMFAWVVERYPDANIALSLGLDGGWNLVVEHLDGRWKHTIGATATDAIEKMVELLTKENL
jgi:hypothetical protein